VTDAKTAQQVCIAYESASDKAVKGALVETQARRVITDISELANGEPLITHSIVEALDEWADGKTGSTNVRYREIAADFKVYLGAKSRRPVQHLRKSDIKGYRDHLIAKGLRASTANTVLKALRSAFNGLKRDGEISHNPAEAVETLEIDALEKEVFTPDQVMTIIDHANEEWKGVIRYAFYTGARLRNCADAKWDQIDWEKLCIVYKPVKKKKTSAVKTLLVPIHPDLLKYFQDRHQPGATGPIFPNLTKKKTGGKYGLSLTFRALLVTAGIPFTAQETTGEGRIVYSLGFHSLRHGFNSALANSGVSQEVRQRLIGHASEDTNNRYTHLDIQTFQKAIATLPSLESVVKRRRSPEPKTSKSRFAKKNAPRKSS
jgi:integrase/recombinase XerC